MDSETRGTILVAESNKDLRWLYQHWLEADSFTTLVAGDAVGLARILREQHVDLLILDLSLAGLHDLTSPDGPLSQDGAGRVRVIGMAGALDRLARGLADRAGLTRRLLKPFSRIELEMAVEEALGLTQQLVADGRI